MEPAAYSERKPHTVHNGHGVWSEGTGWATADLTPGGSSQRNPAYGRRHQTLGLAIGYLDEAEALIVSPNPKIVALREAAFGGDLAARAVLADACEMVGLGDVAAALRTGY